MLEPILGSVNAERVLIFLLAREEGYAREIALYYRTDLNPIQKQLEKFELGGVLISRKIGRTRLYTYNPAYVFLDELKALLLKALNYYPPEEMENLMLVRKRPRRGKKPL